MAWTSSFFVVETRFSVKKLFFDEKMRFLVEKTRFFIENELKKSRSGGSKALIPLDKEKIMV